MSRKENFNWKSCFLKKHEKCKICRFHGVKITKTWFFWMQTFCKIWHVEKFCISKSNSLYFFQSKIWLVVKTSNQNLTRCENFNSKSDKFQKFLQNLIFILFFRFWLIDDIFCQRYYQLILKRRIKRQCVLELVARWTTGSCHATIRLSMCEKNIMTTHNFHRSYGQNTVEHER